MVGSIPNRGTSGDTALNLELPWSSSAQDDKRFAKILLSLCALLVALSAIVTLVKVPELAHVEREKLPPTLTRVILEPQALPVVQPIELPKPINPPKPETPERKPQPLPEPQPKPQPKQESVEQKVQPKAQPAPDTAKPNPTNAAPSDAAIEKAREQAANSGVMQLQDDLAAMREMTQTAAVEAAATTIADADEAPVEMDRALIASEARGTSGGVNTANMSKNTGGAKLAGRQTTAVRSDLAESKGKPQPGANTTPNTQVAARSEEEIRKVMQQHKGAIYSIYNRALRQNPALQGKLVVKLVIDPSGRILEAVKVSSELGDADLETRILQRIKLITFPASKVARTTLNQTFDFLPQ